MRIAIHGDGVAACACARLLQRKSMKPIYQRAGKPGRPTVMLNAATQELLRDVFEIGEEFFAGMHAIRRRVVLWGAGSVSEFPHYGCVANEADLLEQLWERVGECNADRSDENDFSIFSARVPVEGAPEHFGSRLANAQTVHISKTAGDACWVESLPKGWLFLLPTSEREGCLLAIGGPAAELLDRSRLIRREILSTSDAKTIFPAYPRISEKLRGANWLACGGAAMGFDPICGEGAGNAIRQAIAACAAVGIRERENALADYETRLRRGFIRHLEVCRGFYSAGSAGEWWTAELHALEEGMERLRRRMETGAPLRYRMVDFGLEQIE